MTLLADVLANEGFKSKPYKDTLGIDTFGHGLTYITEAESMVIVGARLQHLRDRLLKNKPWLAEHPVSVTDILTEMSFQMGLRKTLRFSKMFAALEAREYVKAAAEMRDSKWFKQTPHRCARMAVRMAAHG